MSNYSKHNFVYRMQKWMDSVPGQTFLNYAYSWGAAVVILGTLFKLTHLPGANFMLFLGMGTEVVVFFLSAFDRPFDKTSIGRELAIHNKEEEQADEAEYADAEAEQAEPSSDGQPAVAAAVPGTIVIASGGIGSTQGSELTLAGESGTVEEDSGANTAAIAATAGSAGIGSAAWIGQQQQQMPELMEATTGYVEQLTQLTEMLGKVNEQSQRLTRDSEEMENLNRTLTGITKVYEMQLKSASQQIGTIDQINEQTQRMAQQIQELNNIYARMIEAMTVNMRAAAPLASTNE